MTLPSRIRNSCPVGLSSSTLPLGHGGSPQYWIFTSEWGRNILFLWNLALKIFKPQQTCLSRLKNFLNRYRGSICPKFSLFQLSLYLNLKNLLLVHKGSLFHILIYPSAFNHHSSGTDFMRQNVTSVDVTFWRIKSVSELKELKYF